MLVQRYQFSSHLFRKSCTPQCLRVWFLCFFEPHCLRARGSWWLPSDTVHGSKDSQNHGFPYTRDRFRKRSMALSYSLLRVRLITRMEKMHPLKTKLVFPLFGNGSVMQKSMQHLHEALNCQLGCHIHH